MKRSNLLKNIIFFSVFSLNVFINTAIAQSTSAVDVLSPILSLLLNSDIPESVECPASDAPEGDTFIVPDGFILISSQEQINDLGRYSRVEGTLIFELGDGESVLNADTDYSSLDSLVEVTGWVTFQFSGDENLESLDVFHCLREARRITLGAAQITTDTGLRKITGFENLITVGGISVGGHDDLEVLPPFDMLLIADFMDITDTPKLKSLPNFDSLITINGGVVILNAGTFTSIDGFPNLVTIDQFPQYDRLSLIEDNPNLVCEAGNVPEAFLPATFSSGNATDCPVVPNAPPR